jgi:hypothetical protein
MLSSWKPAPFSVDFGIGMLQPIVVQLNVEGKYTRESRHATSSYILAQTGSLS